MNTYDSILQLNCPKLISSTPSYSNAANRKDAIDFSNSSEHVSFADKNSEKSPHYKSIDSLEGKKNRLRQKRKSRVRSFAEKNISTARNDVVKSTESKNFACGTKNKNDIKHDSLHKSGHLKDHGAACDIYLSNLLTVDELAGKLSVPSADIIKWLFLQGISITINQLLDVSISTLVAEHYSFNVLKKNVVSEALTNSISESQHGRSRAPVITLLGHVDHGKTTLLRSIRQDDCLIQEAGNITQSLRSYEVVVGDGKSGTRLIFLDTPGHEAFASMRKRGASITDLVILVVSADDGLKPQTIEAINYVQASNLPFLVAINKIDKPQADISQVKDQLSAFSIENSVIDGFDTVVPVSALTGKNVDLLLSSITALSKAQNLKSDPSIEAEGVILEAYLNKQKGPVAQLLILNGTLHVGDIVLAGNLYGKVKAITNSLSQKIESIESAALADILCFTEVPSAGLLFKVVTDEKTAKALAANSVSSHSSAALNTRISLDDVSQKHPRQIIKQVNLIIKTVNQGSIDAIMNALASLPQEKVQINLLLAAPGEVSLKDIELASVSDSTISVFGLSISSGILQAAKRRSVSVHAFSVIYDLIDHIKTHMLQFVDLDYEKHILGHASVKNLFAVNKGTVAGCLIENGKLQKKAHFQLKRSGQIVYTGLIDSLKQLKDDVDEIFEGNECGVMCEKYSTWEIDDLLECYSLRPLKKVL